MKTCSILLLVAAVSSALASKVLYQPRAPPLDRYLTLEEANQWIDSILTSYPTIATEQQIGVSVEGNVIRVIKISTGGTGKSAIYVDSLMHAHEWASLPAALNLISELTEGTQTAILDTADFYIVPIVNPDGYNYAISTDNTWRKNREVNAGSTCIGVDPNRNFAVHFNEDNNMDPCTSNYPGVTPNSAAETIAVADFIMSMPFSVFISLHTPGPYFAYSPAYTDTALPPNAEELQRVGTLASEAAGTVDTPGYQVGSTGVMLGLKFGQGVDYATEMALIPLSYTFELTTENQPTTDRLPTIASEAVAAIITVASNAVPRT